MQLKSLPLWSSSLWTPRVEQEIQKSGWKATQEPIFETFFYNPHLWSTAFEEQVQETEVLNWKPEV